MTDAFCQGPIIGLAATALIDIWAWILRSLLHLPTTNWGFVGRWVGHLPGGQLVHRTIEDASPVRGEVAIGWLFHYAVGAVYGIAYLLVLSGFAARSPTLTSAISFSLALLVAPWLILQPALGHGVFASRAHRPWLVRVLNVASHAVFGMGLYLGWWLLNAWIFR